ncbi:CHAT domain-containing protein [Mycena galopus ATCC 62051]|nr:CHAT domain-containing protein [Mycena galopus ATCC 62051]
MDLDTESGPAFDPSQWIGVGKIYRDVPANVSTACTASRALPFSVKHRLPMADMPVSEFLAVQLASILDEEDPCLKRTSSWFSLQPPDCGEDVVWVLKSIPPLEFILQLLADYPQTSDWKYDKIDRRFTQGQETEANSGIAGNGPPGGRTKAVGRDEGLKRGVRRALALARLPLDEFTKRIKKRLAYTPLVRSEHAAASAKASLGTPAVMKIMSSKAKYGPVGVFLSLYQQSLRGDLDDQETFIAIARQLSDKYNLMAGMTGAISQRQMRRRAAKSAVRLVSPDLCSENLLPALEFAKLMNYDGPWICAGDATKLRPLLTMSTEFSEKNSAHVVGSTFPLRNVLFKSSEEQSRIISEIEAEKAIATQTHLLAFKIPLPGMPVFPVQFRATKGKVKAEELRDIHLEFRRLCGEAGIKLLASSADGASSETKSQRLMMNAQTAERLSYINPKFGVFLSCPVYPDTGPHICTTDPDHARKTARNNFLYGTHFLTLSFVYLCHAVLMFFLTVIRAPLLIKDLFNLDKQDDGAARRLFAPYIFSFLVDASGNLKHPSLEGLFILAFVFGELFDAWMKRDMPHIERVVCVFRARHFLTIWLDKTQGRLPDLFQISTSFLATPSFHILMRLCDQFILLTLAHLEFYPNVPFMPWQHGTHFLEHFFGIARSFITDFSFGQFIEMYKHILIRQRILASGQYSTKTEKDSNNGYIFDFIDSRMKPEEITALKNIPSRAEIDRACQTAWKEAAALAKKFAKMQIPALPLRPEDLHPHFRTPNGAPEAESVEEEEDEEEEVLESTPLGLYANALASETVRVPRPAPPPLVLNNNSLPGSSLSTSEAMAHAAHHVITEQLLAERAVEDEAELAALEERLEIEPDTKKTVLGQMRIAELLNPAPPPLALKIQPIPTFLVAGEPISRQNLSDRKPETDGRYFDGKFSLNHAAHQLKEAVQQSEVLRTETAFQKGRYRWIASGNPEEWKIGCKIHVALGDITVPHIKVRGVTKLNLLRVDYSLVIMRSALRLYLGLVRGIYRYGSVSGKHESFTDAETVDGLSYLSLKVYEQCSFRRNFFQHVSPAETADDYDLALYTHAPISELVYHLNGASLSPLSENTEGLFKLSAGDNGWDRWHVLSGREYRRILELESDEDNESSEEEGEYEEPEEGGRKRKPKPPRGAPKTKKKTVAQKKPAAAAKKPTVAQKPTALQAAKAAVNPPYAPTFSVTLLRQSETEGTRLLGYVEIGQGEVLGSVESDRSTFKLELNKVNPDGPCLKFSGGFTVSKLPYQEVSGLDFNDIPENKIASVNGHGIESELQKMSEDIRKTHLSMDALQLWVMHERILLGCQSNDIRAQWLNMLGDIILQSYHASQTVDDLNQAVCAYNDAVRDDPGPIIYLANLGTSLLRRFEWLGIMLDINRSVMTLEAAVALTPDGHQAKPSWLNSVGHSLLSRFNRLGDLDDLNQSVLRFEAAVALTPDGHPDKPSRLNSLGSSLLRRFEGRGDLDDLNQSVLRFEAAVALTPDGHPGKASRLNGLGTSHLRRFERLGNLDDLNQSVLRNEAAVALTPDGHPDRPLWLNGLGISLARCFRRLGDLDDLNQSVLRFEAAVALTADSHPDKPSRLNDLGNSLLSRFERLGDLDDLNQSVLRFEAAVALTPDGHPDKPSRLNSLGSSLLRRFEGRGDLDDLNQSVLRFEAAVALTPDGHPDKASRLNGLGTSHLRRFERLGNLDDLNQSVLRNEAAVALTPDGHPDRPLWLNGLGISLARCFRRLGDLDDLNQSVLRFEAAVALTADSHPDKPSRLNDLGNSLLSRFERLGDLDDLNQSVLRFEAAVALTPDDDPEKPLWLNSLGTSLARRFGRLGDVDDLNQSVLRSEAAVALTPDGHRDKPSQLNSLGGSLLRRFERLDDLDDLNQSVLRFEAAVALTPDGHPDMPSLLNNLGNSLLSRFERLGDINNLNQSVLSKKAAVSLTPDGHPDKPLLLTNLGDTLLRRFEELHDPEDIQQLLIHYTSAAGSDTGPAPVRFWAAKMWAKHAQVHQPSSVIHAYTTAIELLPDLAWLGLSITDRHHRLSQAGQVVRDAASAAIAVHDYQKAVEWLEQGRSIIWGQLLNLRTPVDELREGHPVLADQLISVSTLLEHAGTRRNALPIHIESQSLQYLAQKSHAHALKRDHILRQIRELSGFERFLLLKPISELSPAAKIGPVAIINISEYGCDALILLPGLADEVIHVPLNDFTIHEAQALAKSLASVVENPGRTDRFAGHREGDMAPDEIFSIILSELWVKIVQPVLNRIAIMVPVSKHLGRIWWCPTGPLAFLPIHAAGLYGEAQPFGSKLSDFLISSYTPSLTALIQGFRSQSESQVDIQLLAVTQPSAEGQSYIPGTQDEIKYIKQHAKGKVPVLWLDKDMATIEKVQKGMEESRWVHFACHGVQKTSPIESALLLAGSSQLTLSKIIELSLPNADLAFLSACQTATGAKDLQDESVHLTAGMLLAGYRGVIGTMWSIRDNDAPQVAGDVYAHLFEASPPDLTRAAEAMHFAVQKLREQLGAKQSFLRWVPFIHFGV